MSTQPAGASSAPAQPQPAAPPDSGRALGASMSAARISLALLPDWRHVRPLRDYVSGLALAFAKPRDFADRCAMCTSELLENAVKYALAGTEIHVTVEMDVEDGVMQICVQNQASPERIEDLQQVLQMVNSGGPFDSYILLLSQAAAKEGSTSKVGLGRVRAEGSAWICYDHPSPGTVRVTVRVPERRTGQANSDAPRSRDEQP